MAQRKPRSGVARGPRGAQAAAGRLRTAAGRGALRWGAGAARRAKRRPLADSRRDMGRGSGGVQSESSSVARQQDTPRVRVSGGVHAESSSIVRQPDMPRFGPSNPRSQLWDFKCQCCNASEHDRGRVSGGVHPESSSFVRQPDTPRFITPFAGVSVFTDADLSSSTRSVVDTGAASGYHLLVVDGYLETKRVISNGLALRSRPFIVGGHRWCIDFFPNSCNSNCAEYISFFVVLLDDNVAKAVKVWFRFSFVNEVEKQEITVIRAASTCSFGSGVNRYGDVRFIKRDVLEQSKNLKNDCFTIRFDMMICEDLNTEDASATQVPLSGIGQHFNHLLQTKVGADVTFEVSGETFSAHRCVLAARSTVFMAQLFGSMKEGTEADAIQVKDMKAKVFKALLSFIYTDTFPETNAEPTDFVMWLQWLEDLIVAADRYDLQHLRFHCEELLSEVIDEETVPKLLDLAVKRHCHRLKEACLQYLRDLSSSTLQALMATNNWKYISLRYPYLVNELIAKLAAKCNGSDDAPLKYVLVEPTGGFGEEMPTQRCVVPAEGNSSN